MMKQLILSSLILPLVNLQAFAGEADIVKIVVDKNTNGSYRFEVTVAHADEGWRHYADKWDILAPDGTLLGTRTLHHPHVDEQPFTRSLSQVPIPEGIDRVTVRAHDSAHRYGGKTIIVELPE